MSKITVALQYPIKAHGEEVSTLEFRRPKFGDLMQLDNVKGDISKFAKLIELCAQIPASSVREIDSEDLAAITEALAPFMPDSQRTGQSSESD